MDLRGDNKVAIIKQARILYEQLLKKGYNPEVAKKEVLKQTGVIV